MEKSLVAILVAAVFIIATIALIIARHKKWLPDDWSKILKDVLTMVGSLAAVVAVFVAILSLPDSHPQATPDARVAPLTFSPTKEIVLSPSTTTSSEAHEQEITTPVFTKEVPVTVVDTSASVTSISQSVRWGPVDGREAGICIDSCAVFIPWEALKEELEVRLLPQVAKAPGGSTVMVIDWQRKKNWAVQIAGPNGKAIGHVWFGPDPAHDWAFDGLIRVGYPSVPAQVWDTFQRFSDGSYRKQ